MKNPFSFKKLLSSRAIREGGRNPYVDWGVTLFIGAVTLISLVLIDISLYEKVRSGEIKATGEAKSTKLKTFNQKDLKLIIEKYNIKSENTSSITEGYRTVPDPSKE